MNYSFSNFFPAIGTLNSGVSVNDENGLKALFRRSYSVSNVCGAETTSKPRKPNGIPT